MATIFVAEDNPILLQGLDRALRSNGHSVVPCSDGMTLIERLGEAESLPDLLLLDIMMPRMGGIEVVSQVRSDPRLRGLPIVLITAATEESLPSGDDVEVLIKPFRLGDLLQRVDARVRQSREQVAAPAQPAATAASG